MAEAIFTDPPLNKQEPKPKPSDIRLKFYEDLVKEGDFTGSYDQFTSTFTNPELRKKFHEDLVSNGDYTQDYDTFNQTFFSDLDVKKKGTTGQDSGIPSAQVLEDSSNPTLPNGIAAKPSPDFENYWKGQLTPKQQSEVGALLPEVTVEGQRDYSMEGVAEQLRPKVADPDYLNLGSQYVKPGSELSLSATLGDTLLDYANRQPLNAEERDRRWVEQEEKEIREGNAIKNRYGDRWYNPGKILDISADAATSFYNSSIASIPNVLGNTIKYLDNLNKLKMGDYTPSPERDAFLERYFFDTSDRWKQYVSPESSGFELEDATQLRSPRKLAAAIGGVAGQLSQIMLSGAVGGSAKAVTAIGALQGISEAMDASKEAGLSDEESALVTSVIAPTIAALDLAGFEAITKTGFVKNLVNKVAASQATDKLTQSAIINRLSNILPSMVKKAGLRTGNVLLGATGEGATEGLQNLASTGVKAVFDQTIGQDMGQGEGNFGTAQMSGRDVIRAAATDAVLGAFGGAGASAVSRSNTVNIINQQGEIVAQGTVASPNAVGGYVLVDMVNELGETEQVQVPVAQVQPIQEQPEQLPVETIEPTQPELVPEQELIQPETLPSEPIADPTIEQPTDTGAQPDIVEDGTTEPVGEGAGTEVNQAVEQLVEQSLEEYNAASPEQKQQLKAQLEQNIARSEQGESIGFPLEAEKVEAGKQLLERIEALENSSRASAGLNGSEVKKTVATTRAYEGEFREGVKQELEKLGLTREVESQEVAKEKAVSFVETVGDEAALEAVRNNDVPDAAAAYIWNRLIENVDAQLSESNTPERQLELEQFQAQLINELSRKALSGGRFSSALGDIYANSNLGYNLQKKIQDYKDANNGVISEDVEARFRALDTELKNLNTKLAEAEKRAADLENAQPIQNIKESITREKKTYTQRAKRVADTFRKLKVKQIVFRDADGNEIQLQKSSIIDWNELVELGAKAIEKTGQLADGIIAIKNRISKEDWYIALSERDKEAVNSQLEAQLQEPEEEGFKISRTDIRNLVESGIDNINDLVAEVKKSYPNLSEREIRDEITGYGKIVNPSQDEVEAQIRKMKRMGRAISALEDIQNKKRPLKSGRQRDKLDAEERALQQEIRELLKDLSVDEATMDNQLKTRLDVAKSRIRNQIEDLTKQIESGSKNLKSPSVLEPDGELAALIEERDRVKQLYDEVFNDDTVATEKKLNLAIQSTERSIAEYERRIQEGDINIRQRKEPASNPQLDALRERRDALKKELAELYKDSEFAAANRLAFAKKIAQRRIGELQRRIQEKDFSPRQQRTAVEDSELIRLRAEKLRVQEEYDKEFYKNKLANRTKTEKAIDHLWELWGLTRALSATGEMSFVGIQGLVQTIAHPTTAIRAFKNSLSFMASRSKAENWRRQITVQPWYRIAKESKLALTEPNAEITAREELFYSGWTNMIWDTLGKPLKSISDTSYERWVNANPFNALERGAVGYLDTIRIERFLQGVQILEEQGKTFQKNKKDYRDVADAINTLTGRASLGALEAIAPTLSKVFFSPRNWSSAIKTSTPYAIYHFGKMTPTGRKMAIADFSKFVGLTTSMLALAAVNYNNDDDEETSVELDPRSTDFGKVKIGEIRIDPWGGRIQQIILQAKLLSDIAYDFGLSEGAVKNKKGKLLPLGVPFKTPTAQGVLLKMATNKLSPTAAIFNRYLSTRTKKENGEVIRVDEFGQDYSFGEDITKSLSPIYWGTVNDLLKDDVTSLDGLLLFYSFFGGGIQVYDKKDEKKKE